MHWQAVLALEGRMSFQLQFFGATEQVTGSLYVIRANGQTVLPDSGYLNEKDAQWENKKRAKKDKKLIKPLDTKADAAACLTLFQSAAYGEDIAIVPGLTLRFHDAGHILGSAIVELKYEDHNKTRTLVFSGDCRLSGLRNTRSPSRRWRRGN